MSKLGKAALNKKVKLKKQKFEFPRGKYQWEIVGYLRKNPGWNESSKLDKELGNILNRQNIYYFFQHPQIDKLIEKKIIEEKSVVQRFERSIHAGYVYFGYLHSDKHKLVTYYRLNPKFVKNYKEKYNKLDLEIQRRDLHKKFQRD